MARNEKGPLNLEVQVYAGIKVQLINRVYKKGHEQMKAKRYLLIPPEGAPGAQTNQNVWIPNKHLHEDGTIKGMTDINYVFRKAQHQLELAGYTGPIIGIKRRSEVPSDSTIAN